MNLWIAHGFGIIGILMNIFCFQCKSSRRLVFYQMLGNVAFAIQFVFLGAITGGVNVAIGVLRNYVVLKKDKPWANKIWWPIAFIIAYTAATILTWGPVYSFLPFIGMTTWTIAMWSRNGNRIRFWNLVLASPSWIIYNILTGAYASLATELISDASIIISYIRYGKKQLDQNE